MHISDLAKASILIHLIMFTNDTNLFYSTSSIQQLFTTMNDELQKVSPWFISPWFNGNKLSLNIEETKYNFFLKPTKKMSYRYDYRF